MSNLLVVGGGETKRSSVVNKLYNELVVENSLINAKLINPFVSLPEINGHDLVLWFPDISNEEVKDYPVKDKGAVLICSKVMREETKRIDAITRIFAMHGNAVITITKSNDKSFTFELIDALGNTWCKTTHIYRLARAIINFYEWTRGSIRKSLKHGDSNVIQLLGSSTEETFKEFLEINMNIAKKVANDCDNRFFGNYSTRCTKLFPSTRIATVPKDCFLFSPRNTNKQFLTVEDKVFTTYEEYYGDRKPSVDTPVQLELYRRFPRINFMIHGHAYIKGARFTEEYFPCGDMREVDGVCKLLEKGAELINLKNHGFLMVSTELESMRLYLKHCRFDALGS